MSALAPPASAAGASPPRPAVPLAPPRLRAPLRRLRAGAGGRGLAPRRRDAGGAPLPALGPAGAGTLAPARAEGAPAAQALRGLAARPRLPLPRGGRRLRRRAPAAGRDLVRPL